MPMPMPLGYLFDIVEGFPTVDLSTGANNGDYVSLKNAHGTGILFRSGIGTAGQDPTVTVQQATSNAGGSVKALNIVTSPVQIWRKQAATSLASTTAWSSAIAGVTTNTWTNTDAAEQSLMLLIYFKGEDLDVDNGFFYLRATIASVGANAQPGDLLYIPIPKVANDPTNVLSYL